MKILIIEDDNDIVESVSMTIHMIWSDSEILSSGLGTEGLDLINKQCPDIVILDLELPDISGFDVLKQVRLFSSVPILILTVRGTEQDMVKGLEMGANEYLVKPFRQMEFLARLKLLLRKNDPSYIKQRFSVGDWQFDPYTHRLTQNSKEVHLTSTECAILSHLVINRGKVVTFPSLAALLWQDEYPGYKDTIQVYIRRLRKKIESDASHPSIIITQPGIGYYFNQTR
jgi:two-component system KDP operon response regulator KdpE